MKPRRRPMPLSVPDRYSHRPLFLVHHYNGRVPEADAVYSPWDHRFWSSLEDAVRCLACDAIDEELDIRPRTDRFGLEVRVALVIEGAAKDAGWILPRTWKRWIDGEIDHAIRERTDLRAVRADLVAMSVAM